MPTLFDVKIGESQSAIEEEMGEDTRVQVRGAGGRFFVQENTVADDGRQLNKQTIGRGSRDVERQIERARDRVSERVDGIEPVRFERQIPSGRFAPEGTQPDRSVPPDRGPEGRFVSGERKPVDSFGRQEIGGQFTPFDATPEEEAADLDRIAAERQSGQDLFESADNEVFGDDMSSGSSTFAPNESERQEFDLPDETVSFARTRLNEEVFGEGRDDLDDLRQRMTVGEPVELDSNEFQTVRRVVSDGRQDAEERADRMDRNIFGDTDEQAERARRAEQGLINNPPSFGGGW